MESMTLTNLLITGGIIWLTFLNLKKNKEKKSIEFLLMKKYIKKFSEYLEYYKESKSFFIEHRKSLENSIKKLSDDIENIENNSVSSDTIKNIIEKYDNKIIELELEINKLYEERWCIFDKLSVSTNDLDIEEVL